MTEVTSPLSVEREKRVGSWCPNGTLHTQGCTLGWYAPPLQGGS